MGGWLLVKRTKFLSCKINWYFMVIYILRIYCFFKNLFTHFPNSTKNFCSFLRIFQIITCPTSHRKDRVVNVCKHKFACTNVTPKRRNGAHFITHAPYCAWVIISCFHSIQYTWKRKFREIVSRIFCHSIIIDMRDIVRNVFEQKMSQVLLFSKFLLVIDRKMLS